MCSMYTFSKDEELCLPSKFSYLFDDVDGDLLQRAVGSLLLHNARLTQRIHVQVVQLGRVEGQRLHGADPRDT